MSEWVQNILERLAEMFPKQTYQTKLDRYVASRNPENAADVDRLIRQFDSKYQTR
jgi:predicted transcriptional regulator with HTH domain